MLYITKHNLVREWPQLDTSHGALDVLQYAHEDGRQRLVFASVGDSLPKNIFSRYSTRLSYRVWEDGSQFLGISLAYAMRGSGLSKLIIEHFIQHCSEIEGQPFTATGLIHKPLIALVLSRVGLVPQSTDFMAEILPKSAHDVSKIPNISVLKDDISAEQKKLGSAGGAFYKVTSHDQVIRKYPINSPEMVVALHTRYLPTDQ